MTKMGRRSEDRVGEPLLKANSRTLRKLMKCKHCEGTGHNMDNALIGERMVKLRLKSKITTRELAESAGMSHSYVWLLENGRRNWRPSLMRRYIEAISTFEKQKQTSQP